MMNWMKHLKKVGLMTSIASLGVVGLVAQTQADIYARSYLDISNLTITPDNTTDAGTFTFTLNTSANLNGTGVIPGNDTCTNASCTPILATDPIVDAGQSIVGSDPTLGENDFNFYGAGLTTDEFARADTVVTSAQLATGTPSAGEQIAEAQLTTGTSALGNAGLDSTTQLDFSFDVFAAGTTLVLDFDAIVNQLAYISDINADSASASSIVTTFFTLSRNNDADGTEHTDTLSWNPNSEAILIDGSCGDSTDNGGSISCLTTAADANLNKVIGATGLPNDSSANVGSGDFTGIFFIDAVGSYTLTLGTTTRVTLNRVPTAIPEPASLLLLGSGLMGLGFARRRKVAA